MENDRVPQIIFLNHPINNYYGPGGLYPAAAPRYNGNDEKTAREVLEYG